MVRDVSEIMKELGWTDGVRIPVANEENKKLEDLLEDKTKEKAQLIADTEEATDRLDAIKKHLIAAEKQRKTSQELLHATRRELDVAQGLERTARAERDSIQRHMREIDKELQELCITSEKLKAELSQRQNQIEKQRKVLRFESDDLFSLDEKHTQGEVDLQILRIDLREDASVFKELEIKRGRLQMEVEQKRKLADSVTTEVAVLEETLDRTAQMYRQMHDERCTLLKQWETSVRALHRKDQDITKTLAEIVTLRQQGRVRMAELIEGKEMVDNLKTNNMETEATVNETQRLISNLKSQDLSLAKNITDLQNELFGLQRIMTATYKRIESQKAENRKVEDDIFRRQERIEAMKILLKDLRKRLEEASKSAMSAEQRAEHMENLIKGEQHQLQLFTYDIRRLQGLLYRTQQEYSTMLDQKKLQEIEISTRKKGSIGQLRDKGVLEEALNRTKEQLYNLDNEELMLKCKLSAILGESAESFEKQQKQAKLSQVEEVLKDKKEVLSLLNTQIERLDLDYRQLSNMMTATNVEVEKVKDDRLNLQLMVDGGKRALKAARTSLNDALIELALQKVKANQMEMAEKRESGKLFCLKKDRIEFETAAKVRLLEINAIKDKQLTQRKLLMESRSMITQELHAINNKINLARKRFEIASDCIGRDEFGEYLSPIQLKIQMTQERLLLLKEGDTLDAKIKKAEKEIEAMENTLKVVNVTNDNYRNRLSAIDPEGPEAAELRQLEQKYLETMMHLKKYREKQEAAEENLCDLDRKLQILEARAEEMAKLQSLRATAAADLSHELREQDVKLHRAESQLCRIIRELRNRSNSAMFLMEEKDIMIRDIIDRNNNALEQLSLLASRHLDVGPAINRLLEERGLTLPPPKSRGASELSRTSLSSSSSSICSEGSSVSSCTAARKIFHPPKLTMPFRGTTQSPSQLQFPMKETIICCAPHSPITMSSETLSLPSDTAALHSGERETTFGMPMMDRRATVQIHPTPSASLLLTTAASKHSITESAQSISTAVSQKSSATKHSIPKSEEGADLLKSLSVEPLTSGRKKEMKKTASGKEVSVHDSTRKTSSTALLFTKSSSDLPLGSSEALPTDKSEGVKASSSSSTPADSKIASKTEDAETKGAPKAGKAAEKAGPKGSAEVIPEQPEEKGEQAEQPAEKAEQEAPEQPAKEETSAGVEESPPKEDE